MAPTELDRLAELGWPIQARGTLVDGVWRFGDVESVSYPAAGFAALAGHAGGSYWFDHRADAVADALAAYAGGTAVWELGAGSGAMTGRLAALGYEVVAVEPLIGGASAIAETGDGPVLQATLEELDLPTGSLPVVGMFDVLEHLWDPARMLAQVRRVLAPGGLLVVTVPAMRWLWSDEDDAAGHQQRFTRTTLADLVMPYGFERLSTTYLFASLLPPAALVRAVPYRLGRRRDTQRALDTLANHLDPPQAVDRAARALLRAESALARRVRLPFGTSVLGVFRSVPPT